MLSLPASQVCLTLCRHGDVHVARHSRLHIPLLVVFRGLLCDDGVSDYARAHSALLLLRIDLLRSLLFFFLVLLLSKLLVLHLIQIGQAFVEIASFEQPTEALAQLAQVIVNLVQLRVVDERCGILHFGRAVPAR